jgi:hypothetical protein
MNKVILLTTLVSFLYFAYMKYYTTHPMDTFDFVIMVFFSMIFGAWMIAALVIALESNEECSEKL